MKEAYYALQKSLNLSNDEGQLKLIDMLETYQLHIEAHELSLFARMFGFFDKDEKQSNSQKWKSGIYIWGGVGRGKSMLLRLFFEHLQIDEKHISHFHQFMLDFHNRLHAWQDANARPNGGGVGTDSVSKIAKEMIRDYKVICLDELQVNNIADAMVLSRLFSAIIKKGVLVFITSNFPPEMLFQDGLQRERFLPFIDLINNSLNVFKLDNFQDYRMEKVRDIKQLYYFPLDDKAENSLKEILRHLIGTHTLKTRIIKVYEGRNLKVLKTYGSVAVFHFNELCKIPLGAVDYIALCEHFRVFIIRNIPKMGNDGHNEALRFITLIDTLYDHKAKLICTSEVPINELYSGHRHSLEFTRLTSRLYEMQTRDYNATEKY